MVRKNGLRLWAVAFWLLAWQLAAVLLEAAYPNGGLLLASPAASLARLGELAATLSVAGLALALILRVLLF